MTQMNQGQDEEEVDYLRFVGQKRYIITGTVNNIAQ